MLTDKIEQIKGYGKFKYSPERITVLLGLTRVDRQTFLQEFENPESDVRLAYEQGVALGEYEIDEALLKMATDDNVIAATELSRRRYYANINRIKKELFGI